MKTRLFLCALILPLAAMAARPRSVTLVIQETGLARISETHDLEPPGPDGLIRIAPLPATLVPASVTAVPIERGESLDILAQRFAWDLLDNESLFRAYRGATIVGRKGGETIRGRLLTPPDFSDPHPALVLAADDPAVRLVPNLLELDAVEFPARPELARTPTLVWQLADGRPPPALCSSITQRRALPGRPLMRRFSRRTTGPWRCPPGSNCKTAPDAISPGPAFGWP